MQQQNIILVDNYEINKSDFINKGNQGSVYACKSRDQTQWSLCAKILNAQGYDNYLMNEIEILNILKEKAINNPNVVKVYLVKQMLSEIIIIMERCEKDLKGLQTQQQYFSVDQSLNILRQLVNGYRICYENSILHRDIKPENVLVLNGQYKLADFGVGKVIEKDSIYMTKVGSPVFQAPQLLLGQNDQITSKLDVYSLGLVMFKLIFGQLPFIVNDQLSLLEKAVRNLKTNPIRIMPNSVVGMTQEFAQLIESMVRFEEADRISWEQLFSHRLIGIKAAVPIQLAQLIYNKPGIQKLTTNIQQRQPGPVPLSSQSQQYSQLQQQPQQPIRLQTIIPNQAIIKPLSLNSSITQPINNSIPKVEPITYPKLILTSEDQIYYEQLTETNRLATITTYSVQQQIWDILNWLYKFTAEFEEYSYANSQYKNDLNFAILLLKGLITSLAINLHNQTTNRDYSERFKVASGQYMQTQQETYLIYEILKTAVNNHLQTMNNKQFVTNEIRESAKIISISIKDQIVLDSDLYLTYFLALFQDDFDKFFPYSPSNNYSLGYLRFLAMLRRLIRRDYTLDNVNGWPSVQYSEYNIINTAELRRIITSSN